MVDEGTATAREELPILVVPAVVCVVMLAIGLATSALARVDVRNLFVPYLATGMSFSLSAVICFVFFRLVGMARVLADSPVKTVAKSLRERAILIALPAIVMPVFLAGYTAAKCAIPFLVGYTWDPVFASLDQAIFGNDVWRLTHKVIGTSADEVLVWCYTVMWGGLLFVVANAVALMAPRRFVGTFFTAMFFTWFIGGCVMAYGFSAAGPVFAGLFEPSLAAHFEQLHLALDGVSANIPITATQAYLVYASGLHTAAQGAGISAMPSMHMAVVTIYVCASRRTAWRIPAIAFWALIFFSSGYFGYHYWVDGLVAAAVATIAWTGSQAFFGKAMNGDGDDPISVGDDVPHPACGQLV